MKTLRIVSTVAALFVLLALLLPPGSVRAQAYDYQEDFEDGLAQGWELESGWRVTLDGSNRVLSGQGHTWARSNQSFTGDMRLSFRVKLLGGRVHFVLRLTDAGRYFIGFDADGSDLNKQYFPDEFHNSLASGSAPHSPNRWYQVEIVMQGSTVEFLVDGTREWSYTDPQPLAGGSFAFETLDDSQAYVDDIRVETGAAAGPTATRLPASSLAWVRTGGPLGGLGYDVRMRPDNPDIMLVSDAWAGVFMSTDGGVTWQPSNTGITVRTGGTGDAIPIFCLTIDPVNPDIVWVGTQYTRGIFKSTDGGGAWNRKERGVIEQEGITFRGFAVDPTNSNVVYAAAELSSWAWNNGQPRSGREFDMTGGVVYKTTDGGENWTAVWRGNNLARYIWIDPRDTRVLYLSTGIFDREAANSDPQAGYPGGEGVLKSTDGGATWRHINNGLNNLYVGSLFMHPANPDILLAGTGNNQYFELAGVYLSQDGGASWEHVLGGENIEAVEFSSSDPSIAYAGSAESIYRSEDGGATWERVAGGEGGGWGSPGIRAGFPIDFQVDPRNPDRIFANEYGGGNFLSEDGGRTWVDASRGYTGAQVRSIAVDPTRPGRVIAAARSGIFVSADGGTTWTGLSNPPVVSMEWNAVAIDPDDPNHLVAETNWGNILIDSKDGGMTWLSVYELGGQRIGWRVIVFAPSDPNIVYAGSTGYFSAGSFDANQPGAGIFVSHNGGIAWSPANGDFTGDASIFGLAVDPRDSQVVYAASSNYGLLKSTDGGQNWQQVQDELPQTGGAAVAIDPADPAIILAGFERRSLFLSVDGGETWKTSATGLIPEANITSIVFDPADSSTIYAADISSGVYRSLDGGRTWTAINNGLSMRSVNALAISYDGLHLYAASEGGGVFRLDLDGQPPPSAPRATAVPSSPAPTDAPAGEPGICGGAAILPLALLGLIWQRASGKRGGR
ncbi:MAG: hypothetical protein FJZ96_11570 [Chloroflexi bacterium]|nr:hypothetical protein [Chloroflexota bacterium]